jgi:broad specificity phosphatase PhoE
VADRVLFVSHGSTDATRRTRFPQDEPLEENTPVAVAELAVRLRLPPDRYTVGGPERRCRETALGLGLTPTDEPRLSDWDLGAWAGLALDEVAARSPAEVQAWITRPDAAPHGGETLDALLARVAGWLDEAPPARPHRCVAVTHPAVVRAAVGHALQAPAHSFWRIDVAPLAVVELRGRPGRWSLHP